MNANERLPLPVQRSIRLDEKIREYETALEAFRGNGYEDDYEDTRRILVLLYEIRGTDER